jgi:hypothetical protein
VGDELVLVGSTDHNVTPLARIGADEASALVGAAAAPPPPDRRGFGPARARRPAAPAAGESLVDRLRDLSTRRT